MITRKHLIYQAELATISGNFKLAILKYKQSIEKGIKQNGRITRRMILDCIDELNQKINEKTHQSS